MNYKLFFTFLFYWIFFVKVLIARGSRDYENRHYYVFHFSKDVDPIAFSDNSDFVYEKALENLENHYLFSISKEFSEEEIMEKISNYFSGKNGLIDSFENKVLFYQKQHLKTRSKRSFHDLYDSIMSTPRSSNRREELEDIKKTLNIHDPIFNSQWHLFNIMDKDNDINVTGVWKQGITGKNVVVALIDDGLDMNSEDLKNNYYAPGSYDFNDHNPVPVPKLPEDTHGTRCAGELAAVRNDVCGIGVAYESKVSGIRILSGPITDLDEAESLNYDFHTNQIYSCSWGPDDDGKTVDGPSSLVLRALVNGINKGRNGLGSIYVFASGNGGVYNDNCNFDGYANSVFTITIGGIDKYGNTLAYSEACSSQLAVTYAGGSSGYIYTTDVGIKKCTDRHGGTSAAAPLASGIIALVLSIRPKLTWRDLQALIRETAIPINTNEVGWEKTYSGLLFHDLYGFGKLSAFRMVEVAKNFKHLKPQARFSSKIETVNKTFSKNKGIINSTIVVEEKQTNLANLETLEHLIVSVNIAHTRRGDLEVCITSPNGIVSRLATRRPYDYNNHGIFNWDFMSVKHWGETFLGSWTIQVSDKNDPEVDGVFIDWQLHLWGEAIDPKKAVPISYYKPVSNNGTYNSSITSTKTQTTMSSTTFTTISQSVSISTTSGSINATKTGSIEATKTSSSNTVSSSTNGLNHSTGSLNGTNNANNNEHIAAFFLFWKKNGLYFIFCIFILSFISSLCYIGFKWHFRRKRSLIEESYEFEILREDENDDISYLFEESERTKILQENPEIYTAFDIHSDFDDTISDFRNK
ncbi:hypothetical protein PORY_001589 [Pneumocystis oryctolagi]|uniref:Uncharacterized protein n=1 Tax=Pneumocystis oryctolagi TaxID=42067 RepID=A0ACB7CB16_9ASCO|nr:hypothetical protein PORY_001589 [Pneumocystis oryctolagi]